MLFRSLAFSTGNRVPHYPKPLTYTLTVVPDDHLDPLFEAAEEATEEAILNALTMATTTVGRDGNTAYALPLDRLSAIMKKYGRTPAGAGGTCRPRTRCGRSSRRAKGRWPRGRSALGRG